MPRPHPRAVCAPERTRTGNSPWVVRPTRHRGGCVSRLLAQHGKVGGAGGGCRAGDSGGEPRSPARSRSEVAAALLLALYGLEQGLEVALAEAERAVPLD